MSQETMTQEQMIAEINRLRAANAALAAKAKPSGSIKVSAKGAVSVYGLGRFPVTLYASQWEALFARQEEVKQFILDNVASLASKTQEVAGE